MAAKNKSRQRRDQQPHTVPPWRDGAVGDYNKRSVTNSLHGADYTLNIFFRVVARRLFLADLFILGTRHKATGTRVGVPALGGGQLFDGHQAKWF